MLITDLPDCMLEQIFEHLSYDEIAKKRLVSVRFNKICQGMLNIGLHRMMRRHASNLKRIKSQLPRRESERRNHALAKHADILTCIETRMSMLSMTYTKYIDLNLCCFIPGKIVDEVMAILSLINSTTRPLRAHEVLQELRDISSMAIDHFDDKIAPTLKKSFCDMSTLKLNQSMFQTLSAITPNASISEPASGMSAIDYAAQLNVEGGAPLLTAGLSDQSVVACRSGTRALILKLDHKCDKIMKKLRCVLSVQKRQSRHIRRNTLRIRELKTEMLEFRRHMENPGPSMRAVVTVAASPPIAAQLAAVTSNTQQQPQFTSSVSPPSSSSVERTLASSSSDSIVETTTASALMSRTSTVASSSPASSTLSPGTISSSGSPDGGIGTIGMISNIKPRAATILLKRRPFEVSESSSLGVGAKIRRLDVAAETESE